MKRFCCSAGVSASTGSLGPKSPPTFAASLRPGPPARAAGAAAPPRPPCPPSRPPPWPAPRPPPPPPPGACVRTGLFRLDATSAKAPTSMNHMCQARGYLSLVTIGLTFCGSRTCVLPECYAAAADLARQAGRQPGSKVPGSRVPQFWFRVQSSGLGTLEPWNRNGEQGTGNGEPVTQPPLPDTSAASHRRTLPRPLARG